MKKYDTAKPQRSFRRFIRQLFSALIKRQNCDCKKEHRTIIKMLQEIDDSIEIIAREMARQLKRSEE